MGIYSANDFRSYTELEHSGRLGQKWHVKHGPPYPLGERQLTGAYRKNGGLSKSAAKRDGVEPGSGRTTNGRTTKGSSYRSAYSDENYRKPISNRDRKQLIKDLKRGHKEEVEYGVKVYKAQDAYQKDLAVAETARTQEERDALRREAEDRYHKAHPGMTKTTIVEYRGDHKNIRENYTVDPSKIPSAIRTASKNENVKEVAKSLKSLRDDNKKNWREFGDIEDKFARDYAKRNKLEYEPGDFVDFREYDNRYNKEFNDYLRSNTKASETLKRCQDSHDKFERSCDVAVKSLVGKYGNKKLYDSLSKNNTVTYNVREAINFAINDLEEEERQRNR